MVRVPVIVGAVLVFLIATFGLWWFFRPTPPIPQEADAMQGQVNAPDFPDGLHWLNTDRPLSLRELRGKVVLLDFWTYCCINCMHILPDLKRLEQKYANELVVIGVHSAKFFTEQETENIRQAILRYEIEHPVVNDNQMIVWSQYGVRAWPTLVLIDPQGKIVGYHSGEGIYEIFDKAIAQVIETFEARGQLDRTPIRFKLERDRKPRTVLNFPGKVLANETHQRLFIADSNHHRILVVSLKDHTVQMTIGSGVPGFRDGDFDTVCFRNPQGMAYDPKTETLYIADTDNHAIRKADLKHRKVETIAGTGNQSRVYPPRAGKGPNVALNSPWDLVLVGDTLYIAMAGSHQLWRMNVNTLETQPHAGTGREACIDGPLRGSALAQPSGITTNGTKLYFADSEVSCIRSADIDPNGRLETLVGGDLFEFGDVDGVGRSARLQHPLGVVYHEGFLYVADTYNNKIKRLDPQTRRIETLVGTGEEGITDGENARFDEPGGITYADGKLYVADTNNHLIRVVDLKTRKVSTLSLKGLERMKPPESASIPVSEEVRPTAKVAGTTVNLRLEVNLPKGYKLNPNARSFVRIQAKNATLTGKSEVEFALEEPVLETPLVIQSSSAEVEIRWVLYYCRTDNEGLCYFYERTIRQPIDQGGTQTEITVSVKL